MSKGVQVTFDCAAPDALAAFWAEALGYVVESPPQGFATWDEALDAWGVPPDERDSRSAVVDPDGSGPRLFFQRVPETKVAKNRVHLDVRVALGRTGQERMVTLQAEADRLVRLGADVLYRVEPDGAMEQGYITLADPEGNELCLD